MSTSTQQWDSESFPIDLPDDIKQSTFLRKNPTTSNWDVPESSPKCFTFSGWEKWQKMLYKHDSSQQNDHSRTSSDSTRLLPPAWEMPVSRGEGLGFYKGMRLDNPVTAPSVIHPDFIYPETEGVIRSRTIKPYYPFSKTLSSEQNLLNAWLVSSLSPPGQRLRTGIIQSPQGRPPIHSFVRESHEKFSTEHYSSAFLSKCKLFQSDYEERVTLLDYSQLGSPNTKIQTFDPTEEIENPFLKLDQLCNHGPHFIHIPAILQPSPCLLVQAQRLLVAFSHLPFSILLQPRARSNFEWSCHILSHEWEGSSSAIKAQIDFTLRTLAIHIKWYGHHQESLNHFTYLEESYEGQKEGPRALLDAKFEFDEKYIYGCGSSDDEGKPSTLSKSEINGQLDHLKDKAKSLNPSFQEKKQILEEIKRLKVMKSKLEATMNKFEEQAKEACKELRSHDSLALRIRNLNIDLEVESEYFAYYWDLFHNLVTFGFPHFYQLCM